MSRTVETRIKIGIESSGAEAAQATISGTARGAKEAQQAFAATEAATAALYDAIGTGGPEAQRQLETLTESFARLRQEMSGLGEGVRVAIDGILAKLESLDLEGAQRVRAEAQTLPAPIAKQVDAVLTQTQTVAAQLPDPAPLRQVVAANRDDMPPATPPEPPRTLLRNAVEAIKDGDLENARRYQTAAARGAIAVDDQQAFKVATEIPAALRQHAERDNGLESSRRYEATMKRLEGHLDDLTEPDGEPDDPRSGPSLGGRSALGRAARTLSGVDAALEGGIRRQSEFDDLTARLGRSRAYLGQAEKAGVPDGQLSELQDQLEALTDALEKSRKTYDEAQRRPSDPNGPPNPDQPSTPGAFDELLETFARRIPTGGAVGRALPPVAAVAGAWQLGNLADRWLVSQNRDARAEYEAQTDLSRQLGIWSDPWDMLRSPATGMSRDELLEIGYTSTDAGRMLAQIDRPANAYESRSDATDALRFAHSTGLDESHVANALRVMGRAGTYAPGGAEGPLETLKMTLTDAVKNGVSQADTMNALVELSQRAITEGRTLPPEALAFNAALLKTLADTGNKALQGEAGARAAGTMNSLITGQGDMAMQMALSPVVENVSAADLGLEGDAARGYERLKSYDQLAASKMALDTLSDGRNPELMGQLAGRMTALMGDNPSLLTHLLQSNGFSAEQTAAILGAPGGLEGFVDTAAELTPEYARGKNLDTGPQKNNQIAKDSAEIAATRRDLPIADSFGDLAINGGADLDTTRGQRLKTESLTRGKTALGQGDDQGPQNLRGIDRQELDALRLRARTPGEERELLERYEKTNGEPAPMSGIDRALQRFNDLTSPQRLWREWFGDDDKRPEVAPPTPPTRRQQDEGAAVPESFEDALGMMGASAITMRPGEIYSGLEGTPAEDLNGRPHRGIDLRIGRQGRPDPIKSPWESAEITDAGYSESYGHWMSLEAQNGSRWQMGHLEDDMTRRIGDTVARGDYLATEGNSGKSTGYHLDLRALDDKGAVDAALNSSEQWFVPHLMQSLGGYLGKSSTTPQQAQEQIITVRHEGLDRIQVSGLEPKHARKVESIFAEATKFLYEPRTPPESHQGFG